MLSKLIPQQELLYNETRSETSLETAGHDWLIWTAFAFACNLQAINLSSLGLRPIGTQGPKRLAGAMPGYAK